MLFVGAALNKTVNGRCRWIGKCNILPCCCKVLFVLFARWRSYSSIVVSSYIYIFAV